MSETPEQMADRIQNEVTALAMQHLDMAAGTFGVDLDKHAYREVAECGIQSAYLATMQVLIREGLLPSTETSA